jgi:hypothetical protein
MLRGITSRIMPRTTIDLDAGILRELKRRKRPGQSLGRLASELLASALHEPAPTTAPPLHWRSARMDARVDLDDKDAVRRATDTT